MILVVKISCTKCSNNVVIFENIPKLVAIFENIAKLIAFFGNIPKHVALLEIFQNVLPTSLEIFQSLLPFWKYSKTCCFLWEYSKTCCLPWKYSKTDINGHHPYSDLKIITWIKLKILDEYLNVIGNWFVTHNAAWYDCKYLWCMMGTKFNFDYQYQ